MNHQEALIVAHPECPDSVLSHADFIGSTRAILEFVLKSPAQEFLVATERHIIHQMQKAAPHKTFLLVPGADGGCSCSNCPFMALNTLEKVYLTLLHNAPRIELPEALRQAALKPLEKMLAMSASVPVAPTFSPGRD